MSLQIKCYNSPDSLGPDLLGTWNSLAAEHPFTPPYLTVEWLTNWWAAFHNNQRAYIITAWDGDTLIAILPLQWTNYRVKKYLNFKCLEAWVSNDSPGFDLICKPQDTLRSWEAIRRHLDSISKQWDVLHIKRWHPGSEKHSVLKDCFLPQHYEIIQNEYSGSFVLPMSGNFDAYYKSLSPSFFKSRVNKNNRLAKAGKLEYKHYSKYSPEIMDIFLRLDKCASRRNEISAITESPERIQFYERINMLFDKQGQFSMNVLYLDDKPIVCVYGLQRDGRYSFLKQAVDYDLPEDILRRTSPGQGIFYFLLKRLYDEGKVTQFDFCGPFYKYEEHWTKNIEQKYNVLLLNKRRLLPRLYSAFIKFKAD